MKLEQVSDHCYAVINEKNRLCDSNAGLINLGGGLLIDTMSDLTHAREMIELFSKVAPALPRRVVITHEDADHVWGNQLFADAEFLSHRSVPDRMQEVADPTESQQLLRGVRRFLVRTLLKWKHPGIAAVGQQLLEDYDFDGIELKLPTTLFDDLMELDFDGTRVELIYVGPAHQVGDVIVHVPSEGVVFTGDIVFNHCTPMGWTGSFENWIAALERIEQLQPQVVVPGHGPVCGLDGVQAMKAYLEFVRDEAKMCFDRELTSLQATEQIELGPYADWHAPARLYMNVERAYREFRGESPDAPWDVASVFDTILKVAKAKNHKIEF